MTGTQCNPPSSSTHFVVCILYFVFILYFVINILYFVINILYFVINILYFVFIILYLVFMAQTRRENRHTMPLTPYMACLAFLSENITF